MGPRPGRARTKMSCPCMLWMRISGDAVGRTVSSIKLSMMRRNTEIDDGIGAAGAALDAGGAWAICVARVLSLAFTNSFFTF